MWCRQFNTLSYINYTKTSEECAQIQHNKQGWPFLPSGDLTVAGLMQDGRVHNVRSLMQTTGHCIVVIYYINQLFWPIDHLKELSKMAGIILVIL